MPRNLEDQLQGDLKISARESGEKIVLPAIPQSDRLCGNHNPVYSNIPNSCTPNSLHSHIYANIEDRNASYKHVPRMDHFMPINKMEEDYALLGEGEDLPLPSGDVTPPPASPVSSSYSELHRTMRPDFMQDYENYGIPMSRVSSTYESIYEPINPRSRDGGESMACTDLPSNYSSSTYANTFNFSSAAASSILGISPSPAKQMSSEAEADALTNILVQSLQDKSMIASCSHFYGECCKCKQMIKDEDSSCTAMNKIYHITCFTCNHCDTPLNGKQFYWFDDGPYCKHGYLETLEKCCVCLQPILDRILRATGRPYHQQCFKCIVCHKSLDGIAFTVDAANRIHCIEDFHKKFAPRCCVCKEPIMPESDEEETVRVVALDRSFHTRCYKCEDCGLLLKTEAEGRGCYPLDDHVLCKSCNAKRVQALTSVMTTEL